MKISSAVLLLSYLMLSVPAAGAIAERAPFGTLAGGTKVELVALAGRNGVRARVTTYGATLKSFEVPDRTGADFSLGYGNLASYIARPNYWDQSISRYADRIARGRFALLRWQFCRRPAGRQEGRCLPNG